jgi:predicted acyl esterase
VTVERQEAFNRNVNGKSLRLTRWLYAPAGREFHVLADDDGLVYYFSGIEGLPSGASPRNAYFVREGYESLREPTPESEPISKPQFQVDLRTGVEMRTRDGVVLSTDLYLPAGARKSPVILIRTPYSKDLEVWSARFFARRGYAVAVQDVRGRGRSGGKWEPYVHEATDGYDAIEWLARQPWSTGKIGMIGASYLGWAQWWAASLRPPHLAAMIPNVIRPNRFSTFHTITAFSNSSAL